MTEKIKIISNQKGASIIAVIAIMLILAVMGAALVSLVTTGSDISVNQLQSEQAFQIAEGGREYALKSILLADYGLPAGQISVPVVLGNGSFTVQTDKHTTAVTDNPLLIGSTTINVASTAGYLIPGSVKIEDEYIFCQVISSLTQLTSCFRGYGGSAAAQHSLGREVLQYVIKSSGKVGDATRVVGVVVDGA